MSGQPLLCNFIDLVKDIPKRESTDPKYFLSKKINAFVHSEQSKAKQALIFTRNIDPEADSVGVELLRRGINYVRLNIEDIPLNVQVKYSFEKDCHVKIGLKIQDEIVDISNIYVVLYRHFDINTVKFHDQEIINTFSLQQWEDTCQILQSNLTCEWINDFDATNRAADRVLQLSSAEKLGFDIPTTIVTNDPKEAHEFYFSNSRNIVIKALRHHRIETNERVCYIYTHKVQADDLRRFNDLAYAPCILQERLSKKEELRVTIVGDRVFAVEIDSQSTTHGKEDINRSSKSELPKKSVVLDEKTNKRCIALVESFGLKYAALDLVMDKNEVLYFLDLNPTGDWWWMKHPISLSITKSLVDLIEDLGQGVV